ncbi:hypothetical protein ACMD2_10530, partial [Ananas comosus]
GLNLFKVIKPFENSH